MRRIVTTLLVLSLLGCAASIGQAARETAQGMRPVQRQEPRRLGTLSGRTGRQDEGRLERQGRHLDLQG